MTKKSWIFLLPLIVTFLWFGSAPSHAAAPKWTVLEINSAGCGEDNWNLDVKWTGVDGGAYTHHTKVTSGGVTYMSEEASHAPAEGEESTWSLYSTSTYGPAPGTWPIPGGQAMTVRMTLERPKGTVLHAWTIVAPSCSSAVTTFNAADFDGDYVRDSADACPRLPSARANGCPLRDRTLSLTVKSDPKRVAGRLYAPGYPALYAAKTVKIWKVRSGPDLRVATRTTGALGRFQVRVGPGRYYATSPGLVVASVGQASADTSPVRWVG